MHKILIPGYSDVKKTFIIRKYVRDGFRELEVPHNVLTPEMFGIK